jgi:hypothetical protein
VLIATLAIGILLALALHLAAMALAGVLLGATLQQVRLGFGPTLLGFRLRGAPVRLHLFPLGGYVQFWRSDSNPPAPSGVVPFDHLPGHRRAAAQLTGPLVLLAVGVALGGPSPWKPAVDLFRGALSPLSTGPDLLAAAVAAAPTLPLPALLGQIFAYLAAWNLLPVPTLNGGAALLDLTVPPGKSGDRVRSITSVAGAIAMFALGTAWIVAIVSYLRR